MLHSDENALFLLAQAAQRKAIKKAKHRLQRKSNPLRRRAQEAKHQTEVLRSALSSPTQQIGNFYEDKAQHLLVQSGYVLLARQLRCKYGEIDLVMRDGSVLVFVEVRRRKTADFGGCAASITIRKQTRLVKAAKWHLAGLANTYFAGKNPQCRFDVVTFEAGHVAWMRNTITMQV